MDWNRSKANEASANMLYKEIEEQIANLILVLALHFLLKNWFDILVKELAKVYLGIWFYGKLMLSMKKYILGVYNDDTKPNDSLIK